MPHFEKMLYDNALLEPVYLDAWKQSGRNDFLRIAEETLAWAGREMTHPEGGFYATLDADSEEKEGRFYLWTRTEIEQVVGPADGMLVADFLGAGAAGNAPGGRNVLHVPAAREEFARSRGLSPEAWDARLEAARRKLLSARSRRVRPRLDNKVLAGWNGLMISACARAHKLTGDRTYLDQGERAARFVLKNLFKDDRLRVSWRQGKSGPPGFLDDHAFLARGLLDLAAVTGQAAWRERALALVRAADRFLDRERGGYYFAGEDQDDLIVRPKGLVDDALPSANAVMAECLLRLARENGDQALVQRATRLFDLAGPAMAGSPTSYSYMILAARLRGTVAAAPGAREVRQAARRAAPGAVPFVPEARAATRSGEPAQAPAAPAPGAPAPDAPAPGARALDPGADRVVPGTIVGRASPQRVVTTSLTVPDRPVRPGQAITISLRLDIAPGWHVNSNTPSLEYLIPTKIEFPDAGAVLVDQVVYPAGHLVTLKFADTRLSVYEGANTLRATLRPPRDGAPGESKARARLTYQACSDTVCLAPETVEFLVPLRVEGEPVAIAEMSPSAGAASGSAAAAGGAPRDRGPTGAASGGGSAGGLGPGGGVAAVLAERGLLALLGLVFVGGLALNLTPCIYPMMPVTIGFFATQARSSWPARLGLPALYVAGMAVTYSVLGVVAGLSGGLIGSTLQSPWVVWGLVVLFVVLALSMFGLFELRLPGSITRFGGGRRGPVGALLMGVTMGLVAAPCIGPFIVGLLAYVGASGDPVLGFWLFFVMAIGMGLPNLVLGVFSGSLAALPRSGEWLIYAKKVMGIGMLAVAIYFVQPLLKDRVVGTIAVAFALLAGIYLGFLERTRLESRLFPVLKGAIGVLVVAAGIWLSMPLLGAREEPEWQSYSHEAFAGAALSGRPILIDFYADWCLPCRELDRFTFSDPAVLQETERFILLKADLTQFESDQVREIRERFDVVGVPTIVFLDSKGEERQDLRVYGFEKAGSFLERLRQVR
ncbi:MAG: thioredoxin family protein [Acidobacteria bacterium]|nr:thioredoxin family protein [Acidobacteriota bacterium]